MCKLLETWRLRVSFPEQLLDNVLSVVRIVLVYPGKVEELQNEVNDGSDADWTGDKPRLCTADFENHRAVPG